MTAEATTCRGIYRELDHSPGRVEDDRAIMTCVADALAGRGFSVELVDADAALDTHCPNMFVMCERGAALDRLAWSEVVGTIAGDDTIFVAVKDRAAQRRCLAALKKAGGER